MAQTIKLKRSATQGATPTTSQLALGEVALNTYDGKMYIKKNVGGTESIVEIGTGSGSGSGGGLASSFTLYEYTATANQTTFSGSDSNSNTLAYDTGTPPKILVYLNGVLLDHTTDYTATTGTSVVLTSAAAASDLVQVAAYKSAVSTTLDIDLTDNQKLLLGTDDDLEIYHNGTDSVINQTGTGDLLVQKDETTVAEFTVDGIVVTGDVEADEFIGDLRGAILFKAQAGEALAKGDVVYISGISGNTTIVSKADADDASKMPAFGLAAAAASTNSSVEVYTSGTISGIDTSSFSVGDEVFTSTTAGELTATAPTGESAALQKIGKVTRSHASSGSLFIIGAGRSNAVPNLNEGKLFVGNSSNQAVADDTVHVDIANSVVGINKTNPSSAAALHVDGHIYVDTGDAIYADHFRPYSTTLATYGSNTSTDHYFLGSVGIGTASPLAPLHITNSSTSTPTLLLGKNQTNGITLLGDDYISGENYVTLGMDYSTNSLVLGAAVKVSSTASRTLVSSQDGYSAKGAAIYVDGYGGAIDFYTSNSSAVRTTGAENTNIANRMRIDSEGNVCIGNTAAGAKLDIRQDSGFAVRIENSSGHYFRVAAGGAIDVGGSAFVDANRNITAGTISSGAITSSGNISGAALIIDSATAVDKNSNYMVFHDGSGAPALYAGNTSDNRNYYQSNHHRFRSDDANTNFAEISSVGMIIGAEGPETNMGKLHVKDSDSGATPYQNGNGGITIERNGRAALNFLTPNTQDAYVFFGDPESANAGYVGYEHSTDVLVIKSGGYVKTTGSGLNVNTGNLQMGGTEVIDSSRNITAGTISSGNITTTGYLRGPSTFTIDPAAHGDNTGTVVIAGNLQVDGTTTTINSTTLTVDDKNITLASGAANAAAANGAGLTVDCGSDTDATFTYDGTNDEWDFNKNVKVSGSVGVTNIVTNKVVKFNGTILDDSSITDTGSLITLGTSTDVSGPLQFTSNVSFSSSEAGRIYKASNHGLAFHGVTGIENDFAMFTPAGQLMVVNPTGTNNVTLIPSAGGSVGIGTGTSSPARKLEVKAGSEGYVARFKGSTSAVDIFAGNTGSFTGGLITTPTNIPLGLSTNTGAGVLIIATNNNVGIGTTSPGYKLDISGTTNFGDTTYYNGGTAGIISWNNNLKLKVRAASNHALSLGAGGTEDYLYINTSGNVGIGDDSPDFKLSIRTPAIPSGSTYAWPLDLSRTNTDNRGLSFGVGASGGPHAIGAHNGDIGIGQTYGTDSNGLPQFYETLSIVHDGTASVGKVGIGTTNPSLKLVVDSGSVNHVAQFKSTDNSALISIADNDTTVYVSAENARGSFGFYTGTNTSNLNITSNGNVGIGTNNLNAKLNVEELGIDTTTTSTTATTQVAIDTFGAATFRSARYTIQVTNSTDSTYHITEILLIHDGTTPAITEFGTIFTGSAEATFDADISSGNVRLLATPATTDSMTFKVVRHCITV